MNCLFLATYRLSLLDLSSRIRQTTFLVERNGPTIHFPQYRVRAFCRTNVSVRPTRENGVPRSNVSRIRNKSSAIDPGPQVDVNWYAYNGETIAERDRATVALQKRPFDPIGRAHGWGKIGVKIVISWLCCRATDLLDPLLSHGEFVCFPFLSNQLEMIGWGAKRMRDDWFENQRRRDVCLWLIWSNLEKEIILIMFLLDLSDIRDWMIYFFFFSLKELM